MKRIHFNEVATRDGFQIEPQFIATDAKVALIDALNECGYAKIEVTSFTSPKAIPMLRDAEEVMGRIRRVPGVQYTVLVPNVRGAERALESRADELNLVISVSETHNLANLRMSRERSLATLEWVSWFNNHRLLEPISYIPPAEAEANYWRQHGQATSTTKLAAEAAP